MKKTIDQIDNEIRSFLNNNPLRTKLSDPNPPTAKQRYDNIILGQDILDLLQMNNIDLQEFSTFYSEMLDLIYFLELDLTMERARLSLIRTLKYRPDDLHGDISRLLFDSCIFYYKKNTRHHKKTNFHELYFHCTLQKNLDMDYILDDLEYNKNSSSHLRNIWEEVKSDIFTYNRISSINNIIHE